MGVNDQRLPRSLWSTLRCREGGSVVTRLKTTAILSGSWNPQRSEIRGTGWLVSCQKLFGFVYPQLGEHFCRRAVEVRHRDGDLVAHAFTALSAPLASQQKIGAFCGFARL